MLLSNIFSVLAVLAAANATPVDVPADAGIQHMTFPHRGIHYMSTYTGPRAHEKRATVPSGARLTNYGGPVIPNVQVQPLWYGNANYQSNLNSFYAGVTQSAWFDTLQQYNVGRGSALPGFSIAGATSTTLDDTNDIQPMLIAMVKAGTITPTVNTYFPIHFGPGISITQGGGGSCAVFCAYHGTVDISSLNVGTQYLYYGVVPDQGGNCAGGCGTNQLPVNNLFSVSSHELAEAATDPAVGVASGNAPPLGWYDTVNGEIGDICNAQQGTTVGGDGATYVIQLQFSNAANACVASGGSTPPKTTTAAVKKTTAATTATTAVMTTAATTAAVQTTVPVTTAVVKPTTTTAVVKTTTAAVIKTTAVAGNPSGQPCGATYGNSECVAGTQYYCGGSAPYTWQVWYVGC
ncbi:hypothetical protein HDU98_011657 [Podochytrium sp. JEL0797]|nr:hypothetical protein HDU98_011657 [Podochytrium sp. JEL0797]